MAIGEVRPVPAIPDCHYVDTGMFGTAEYGSVYLIDGERPALVDSGIGADRDRIVAAVESLDMDPAVILLTHVHLDHAGGAGFLADRYNAEVIVHERGARHLREPDRLVEGTKSAVGDMWRHYTHPRPIDEDQIVAVSGGASVTCGNRTLDVHEATGHAPHQVVYHDPEADVIFAGDAAGIYLPSLDRVLETTPPPQFDLAQCLADLGLIGSLAPRTICYGHCGTPVEVNGQPAAQYLTAYRDRLNGWVDAARAALDAADGDPVAAAEALDYPVDTEAVWGREKAHAERVLNLRGIARYLAG